MKLQHTVNIHNICKYLCITNFTKCRHLLFLNLQEILKDVRKNISDKTAQKFVVCIQIQSKQYEFEISKVVNKKQKEKNSTCYFFKYIMQLNMKIKST